MQVGSINPLLPKRRAAAPRVYNFIVQKIFQSPDYRVTLHFNEKGISFGSKTKFISDTKKISQRVLGKGVEILEIGSLDQALLHDELTYLFELAGITQITSENFIEQIKELEMVQLVNEERLIKEPAPVKKEAKVQTGLMAVFAPKYQSPSAGGDVEKFQDVSQELINELKNPSNDIGFGKETKITDADNKNIFTIHDEPYSAHTLIPMFASILGEHVLYDGPWGIGKTTLARTLSCLLFGNTLEDVTKGTIQSTPDANLRKYFANVSTEWLLSRERGETRLIYHPFLRPRGLKIVDEINRNLPEKQNILLGVMNDGFFVVEETGEKIFIGDFNEAEEVVRASWHLTRNRRGEGTFPLEPALLDRISASFNMGPYNKAYLNIDKLFKIFNPVNFIERLKNWGIAFSPQDIIDARSKILNTPVDPSVYELIAYVLSHINYAPEGHPTDIMKQKKSVVESPNGMDSDPHSHFVDRSEAVSDKAALFLVFENALESARMIDNLFTYAKAMAWYRGKSRADISDLTQVMPFILRHRTKIYGAIADKPETIHNLWDYDFYRTAIIEKSITELQNLKLHYRENLGYDNPIDAATSVLESTQNSSSAINQLLKIMEVIVQAEGGKGRDTLIVLQGMIQKIKSKE